MEFEKNNEKDEDLSIGGGGDGGDLKFPWNEVENKPAFEMPRWVKKLVRRIRKAGKQTVYYFMRPIECSCFSSKKTATGDSYLHVAQRKRIIKKTTLWGNIKEWYNELSISKILFPNIPEHFSLDKKLTLLKAHSSFGKFWDAFLIVLSLIACAMYVSETYNASYNAVRVYFISENLITQFFAIDFIYNYLAAFNKFDFLLSFSSFVDFLTIAPIYITLSFNGKGKSPNLSIFRFVRILRLIRIMRMFKVLGGLSGVRRQIITLSLTLLSLVFLAAGIFQIMETDVRQQLEFSCHFINERTNWVPSCSPSEPASDSCDCSTYNCNSFYNRFDTNHHPTGIRCNIMPFFDAFYFTVVTIATVGYGDISPSIPPSRAVVIIFIIISLVIIPMQVNQLSVLLSITSQFRSPYVPRGDDPHVILCGHVSDWRKLEKFFKEFFHPDRANSEAQEYHLIILSPVEPNDNVRALLMEPPFDSKVSYLIGSALSMDDLFKSRADIASAMFFLCNTEVQEDSAKLDDAATVLRTLSVHNYNPKLQCFVQVLKPEDRDILKDSDVDVILCMDEYKTALQARNAICPGLATFVENLFHTFGGDGFDDSEGGDKNEAKWLEEYMDGADKEVYYIPLDLDFLDALSYEWTLIVEGIFLEYDVMLIGVCSPTEHAVLINPTMLEMQKYKYPSRFFYRYNIGVILADEQSMATSISIGLKDPIVVDRIVNKILIAEDNFMVRKTCDNPTDKKSSLTGAEDSKGGTHRLTISKPSKGRTRRPTVNKGGKKGGKKTAKKKGKSSSAAKAYQEKQLSNLREIIRVTKARSNSTSNPGHGDADEEEDDDIEDEMEYTGLMNDRDTIRSRNTLGGTNRSTRSKFDFLSYLTKMSGTPNHRPRFRSNSTESEHDSEVDSDEDKDAFGDLQDSSGLLPSMMVVPKNQMLRKESSFKDAYNHFGGVSHSKKRDTSMMDETFAANLKRMLNEKSDLGHVSEELEDANALHDHIIVFGCVSNLHVFIAELRRPLIVSNSYHAIVVVNEEEPPRWEHITEAYNDVYFIRGKMVSSFDFNRSNVKKAFAVVLLAGRNSVTKVEEENIDADTLFAYLKLEKFIPRSVFFTVELTCASNMAVLNSTVVRRAYNVTSCSTLNLNESGGNAQFGRTIDPRLSELGKMPNENTSAINRKNLKQKRGTFTTQKKIPAARSAGQIQGAKVYSVADSLTSEKDENGKPVVENETEEHNKDFWTAAETHHMLPIFASGRAFVPATFDSLLCQSFFAAFTPLLCEKLVCGQKYQTMYLIAVPDPFIGKLFVDLFRSFLSKQIYVFGLYRAPNSDDKSILPFVFTCPAPDVELRSKDRLYVYGNPVDMKYSLEYSLNLDLQTTEDGIYYITEKTPPPVSSRKDFNLPQTTIRKSPQYTPEGRIRVLSADFSDSSAKARRPRGMSEGNSDSGFLPGKIISSRNSSPGSLSPLRFPIEKDIDEDLDDSGRASGRMSPGYASPGSFVSGGSNSNILTGSPDNSNNNNNNNSLNAYGHATTVRTSSNSSMNIVATRRGSADMSSGFNSARSGPETKSRPSSGEDQRRRRRASRVFQEMEAELSARSRPNSGSNSRRVHPSN